MKPHLFHELPAGFLDALPADMEALLGGPSLIHLRGRSEEVLFISILLHGNEHSSLYALQTLLKRYSQQELPRSIVLFVGNVQATRANTRFLPTQRDYNRIWDGKGDSAEHQLAQYVKNYAQQFKLFACVDVHNNTGDNPHYACANVLDYETLALAGLFSDKLVYYTEPRETLASAFSHFCPSVAYECGLSGEVGGIRHAVDALDATLHCVDLNGEVAARERVEVLESVVRVHVPAQALFDFGQDNAQVDFRFPDNFERLNFVEQQEGSLLGWRYNPSLRLEVRDNDGHDVAEQFLRYEGNEIHIQQAVIPSMFTLDKQAVVKDCLGYFMLRRAMPSTLAKRRAVEA